MDFNLTSLDVQLETRVLTQRHLKEPSLHELLEWIPLAV